MKKVASYLVLAFFLALLGLSGASAENNVSTTTATSTPSGDKKIVNIVCMQTAVEKRDNALIAAVDKYSAAFKTVLATRRDELKAAWGIADKKARRAAIKAAWRKFDLAARKARKTLNVEKFRAWKQFNADRLKCGPLGSSAEDGTTGAIESSL